jgi:DnaJ-domain-containing protein 1
MSAPTQASINQQLINQQSINQQQQQRPFNQISSPDSSSLSASMRLAGKLNQKNCHRKLTSVLP